MQVSAGGMTHGAAASGGHMDRVLQVFESVAAHGPLSLGELSRQTGIPKVSAWRAVRCLRARAWLRCRIADGLTEVAPRVEVLIANAQVPMPEIEEVSGHLANSAAIGRHNVAFGVLFGLGQFAILDATHRDDGEVSGNSLVDDIGPAAALLQLSCAETRRHLAAYARRCRDDERAVLESGAREAELARLRSEGAVWCADRTHVGFPWRFATGAAGCIIVSSRQTRRVDEKAARALAMLLADNSRHSLRLAAE